MKMNKYFIAGAVALAFGATACNNSNNVTPDVTTEGTTYAGMYISSGRSIQPRATVQADYAGRDAEKKIATIDLLSTVKGMSWTPGNTDEEGKFWEESASSGIYKVAPWETKPGSHNMALVINKGGLNVNIATASTPYGSTATAHTDIAALATDNAFVMTSALAKDKTVAADKTKEAVKTGTEETDNVFKMDVERVVAQGLVAKGQGLTANVTDGTGTIKLDDIKYAAVNGAAKTYLFADKAGERTFDDASYSYKKYESAIHAYNKFEQAKDAEGVKENLIRLGNLTEQGGYEAKAIAENADAAKTERGVYFLENSVAANELTTANKKFGFYRLAYAKVYTVFTPTNVYKLADDNETLVKDDSFTPGTTFYKGEQDGLFYLTKEAAKKSQLNPGQKAYTYTNGKCAYRSLWHAAYDAINTKIVKNADTRRNNIYLLTVNEFATIGMPWDPSDPNDPNLPKPEDPEEPTTDPDDPNIEKTETYMRVEAKILPWNLITREVTLEN